MFYSTIIVLNKYLGNNKVILLLPENSFSTTFCCVNQVIKDCFENQWHHSLTDIPKLSYQKLLIFKISGNDENFTITERLSKGKFRILSNTYILGDSAKSRALCASCALLFNFFLSLKTWNQINSIIQLKWW